MTSYRVCYKKCVVPGCPDIFSKKHGFPIKDVPLFNKWVQQVQNPILDNKSPEQIYRYHRVCNIHFAESDKVPGTKRGLMKKAFPTLWLPHSRDASSEVDYHDGPSQGLSTSDIHSSSGEHMEENQLPVTNSLATKISNRLNSILSSSAFEESKTYQSTTSTPSINSNIGQNDFELFAVNDVHPPTAEEMLSKKPESESFCRLCLCISTDYINILPSSGESSYRQDKILEMIKKVIPDLDLSLTYNPGICIDCESRLINAYNFISFSIQNQNTLLDHKYKHGDDVNVTTFDDSPNKRPIKEAKVVSSKKLKTTSSNDRDEIKCDATGECDITIKEELYCEPLESTEKTDPKYKHGDDLYVTTFDDAPNKRPIKDEMDVSSKKTSSNDWDEIKCDATGECYITIKEELDCEPLESTEKSDHKYKHGDDVYVTTFDDSPNKSPIKEAKDVSSKRTKTTSSNDWDEIKCDATGECYITIKEELDCEPLESTEKSDHKYKHGNDVYVTTFDAAPNKRPIKEAKDVSSKKLKTTSSNDWDEIKCDATGECDITIKEEIDCEPLESTEKSNPIVIEQSCNRSLNTSASRNNSNLKHIKVNTHSKQQTTRLITEGGNRSDEIQNATKKVVELKSIRPVEIITRNSTGLPNNIKAGNLKIKVLKIKPGKELLGSSKTDRQGRAAECSSSTNFLNKII